MALKNANSVCFFTLTLIDFAKLRTTALIIYPAILN